MTHQQMIKPSMFPHRVLTLEGDAPYIGTAALQGMRKVINTSLRGLAGVARDSWQGETLLLGIRGADTDKECGCVTNPDTYLFTSDVLLFSGPDMYARIRIVMDAPDLDEVIEEKLKQDLQNSSPYVQDVTVIGKGVATSALGVCCRAVVIRLNSPDRLLHAEVIPHLPPHGVQIIRDNRQVTQRTYAYEDGAFLGLVEVRNPDVSGETIVAYTRPGVTPTQLRTTIARNEGISMIIPGSFSMPRFETDRYEAPF
ncbi:hypothetical protein [Deinococcus aquaticus]|uniref:hypothetical protein n=1 Tax=Deinococcus aquaticus TaxID=328692 RepID=UPI003F46AB19